MVWETAWEERESAPPDPLCTLLVEDQAAALVAGAIGWKVWLASAVEEATREVVEDEVWQVGGRRASTSSGLWTHWEVTPADRRQAYAVRQRLVA